MNDGTARNQNKKAAGQTTNHTDGTNQKKGRYILACIKGKNNMTRNNFFNTLKAERTTYKEMIDFCCGNMILNNDIIPNLSAKGFYFDTFCGSDYDEEEDTYSDVYQYFIISSGDAERLEEYTNELVYFCEELDLYILGVCHFGTPWNGVSANWKESLEEV